MAIHQCNHCSYESERISNVKRHLDSQHSVTQATVERSVNSNNIGGGVYKHQKPNDTFSEASTYYSQSDKEGDIFDRLSTNGSESGNERNSIGRIYYLAYERFSEFIDCCNMASDELDNWGKLDKKSKRHAMEMYALIKMKMIEAYYGLPEEEEESETQENENDQEVEENSEVAGNEHTDSEDAESENDSSEANDDACTCFLSIINEFEDKIDKKHKKKLEFLEEEAAEEIIKDRDIDDDDSEVEPEDGECHTEAKLKTQEKDLKKLKLGYKEEGDKYFQHCSNREITTLCRWCYYILSRKYQLNQILWERCREKCQNQNGIYRLAHNRSLPRWKKRIILQKYKIGEGIVNGMLPLILDTIKSLL